LVARIASLELDLEDTVLRAPSNGVVLEKFKEVGEIAVPGGFAGSGELIRLANMDELRVEVDINESDLSKIEIGQAVEVIPDAYTDRRYRASVVKLYPQINRQKGTLKVEAKILEPDAKLRPDMSVRITFLREAQSAPGGEGVVLAPREAVRSEAGASFVWVVTQASGRRDRRRRGLRPVDRQQGPRGRRGAGRERRRGSQRRPQGRRRQARVKAARLAG
jgi:hypothetical protein